ncbi:MAG TPA: hypothetical protein VM638_00640 [Actinomycetota bacterium]|nr:hypothetical protein [Actinomycetota bacterium]
MQTRHGTTRGHRPLRHFLIRAAWVAVPLVVAGELGHSVLQALGREIAHHFFHIVFGVGAAVVFALYVAIDIRRHGWPSFTLRRGS